jgi:hypothetical protein
MGTCIKLPKSIKISDDIPETSDLDDSRGGKTNKNRKRKTNKRKKKKKTKSKTVNITIRN